MQLDQSSPSKSAVRRDLWGVGPQDGDRALESVAQIREQLGCHPVIADLLWNRGFRTVQALERLLNPDLSRLPDPHSIIDMKKAIERVARAVLSGEQIAIYGDYDVDGTCGASLLSDFFTALGAKPVVYQPNRFTEGYGVHVQAIERLIDQGARVVISVDCGITAVEPAKAAAARGADFIIIDHHKLGKELPAAYAVVDPQRPEDESGLLNVCGAGLAFFFAMGLRTELRAQGFFVGRKEPNLMRLLDLVAVATVADVVDLRGVNRILVSHGLKVLEKSPRQGLKAILEAAKIKKPTAMHCGFILGPRINAAGRLESARAAFELLTCEDATRAGEMARALEEINAQRRQTQDQVLAEARARAVSEIEHPRWKAELQRLPAAALGPWPRALVLAAEAGHERNWHEGVVGIVASKIVEEFSRPVFVLAQKEGEGDVLKGSVRSVSKVDILAAISAPSVARHLINFGGHAHAGGVTLRRENLESFATALNEHLALTTSEEHYRRVHRFDAEISLDQIDGRLVEELQRLEPFGHQFPEPVFKVAGVRATSVKVMKDKHLKLRFEELGAARIEGVWFNVLREDGSAIELSSLEQGKPGSFWVSPQWNEWQGVRRLQLQIRHGELV